MSIIRPIALTVLLSLSICLDVSAQSINLVCRLNQYKNVVIPIDFKKNKQGVWEMIWDGKNVNLATTGDSPSKNRLVNLEISDVKISYKSDYVSYANQSAPEWGQTRIGTISRIDGSWTENLVGYGEMLPGIPVEKFKNQDGKCEPRGVNKF